MSIATNLQRLVNAKSDIADAITAKGGTVNEGDGFEDFATDIESIPDAGGDYTVDVSCSYTATPRGKNYDETISYFPNSIIKKTWYLPDSSDSIQLNGYNVWTDGTNIFFSEGTLQYRLDEATNEWHSHSWSGLTDFNGGNIWRSSTGQVYYSKGTTHKQLQLDSIPTHWLTKSWSGLTSFSGANIWLSQGSSGKTMYSNAGTNYYLSSSTTSTWTSNTYTGTTNPSGGSIWYVDSTHIYYSEGSTYQYKLSATSGVPSTWYPQSWNGYTNIYGYNIWKDKSGNIYYSDGTSAKQYVLNTSTDTWTAKSWNGFSDIMGLYVWKDKSGNVYYSHGSDQYYLDEATSTWYPKTWIFKNIISPSVHRIWSFRDLIYYSDSANQYNLNKSTSTWTNVPVYRNNILVTNPNLFGYNFWSDGNDVYYSSGETQLMVQYNSSGAAILLWDKSWSGLTAFDGEYIWTDGTNIYYSHSGSNFVLNKATSTWSPTSWSTSIEGKYVWTDGNHIYYSQGSNYQYEFDKTSSTWSTKSWPISITGNCFWADGYDIYYSYASAFQKVLNKRTGVLNDSIYMNMEHGREIYGYAIWGDGEHIYYSDGFNHQYELPKATVNNQS